MAFSPHTELYTSVVHIAARQLGLYHESTGFLDTKLSPIILTNLIAISPHPQQIVTPPTLTLVVMTDLPDLIGRRHKVF